MQREMEQRSKAIVRTSVIGILANVLLAAFKAVVGLLSHSIAVVLDAVNNLSDAMSSVITIVGAKLAEKKPDKKHPLGYGRIEYLSAMVVAAIVLYAGITSLVESVKKIIAPEAADYSVWSLVIIAEAVAVKVLLGRYVKAVGERVHSGSLIASGQDALSDAILSASVLLCALLYTWTGLSLEAYVGVVISVFIIKAGFSMLAETLDDILGSRISREVTDAVKATVLKDPQVLGAYDLILHSYGPDRLVGSVHVEVNDSLTAPEIDEMSRRVAAGVYAEHGIVMTGIGIYAANDSDDESAALRAGVTRLVMAHEGVLQMHGFYLDKGEKRCTFDVILDFAVDDRRALLDTIVREVADAYPAYTFCPTMDIDI